jgi:hypothetical protein
MFNFVPIVSTRRSKENGLCVCLTTNEIQFVRLTVDTQSRRPDMINVENPHDLRGYSRHSAWDR